MGSSRRGVQILLFFLLVQLIPTATRNLSSQQYLGSEQFIYANGQFQKLAVPGSDRAIFIGGINNTGDVTGAFSENGCFILAAGRVTRFTVPQAEKCSPHGINDSKSVVGWYLGPGIVTTGFLRSAERVTTIRFQDCFGVSAHAINNKGQIVGGCSHAGESRTSGFLLEPTGAVKFLDMPGATFTSPQGIDDHGQIAGYFYGEAPGPARGTFIFRDGVFTTLENPACLSLQASAISSKGVITGTCVATGGRTIGFTFDTSNSRFTTFAAGENDAVFPEGINDKGQIVGSIGRYAASL